MIIFKNQIEFPNYSVVEEDERKSEVWDNIVCDSVHPDDLILIRQRYENWKLAKKLNKYAQVMEINL